MSKAPLDSDLYGDIYGDDEFAGELELAELSEPVDQLSPKPESDPGSPAATIATKETSTTERSSGSTTQDAPSSLPPKPAPPNPSPALSYSAQIAQQFSTYQQTPSQERQQRSDIKSSSNDSKDSIFGKKPSEMHDAGKMFIGGLNWDTTDEGLRNYFSQFGKVDACTIMRDPSGTSRGFAFLTFEDPASVNAVVAREHTLDGKVIDPKRAIPREEHLRNTRYFVGGLAATSTPDSMRKFFSTYGKVVDATVMVDRDSGRSKGFGFVTFEDASNADQLVGKLGLILDDKQIEVKMAQPRNMRDQTRQSNNASNSTGMTRDNHHSERESTRPTTTPAVPFVQQQQTNPMSMLYQRSMAQVPTMMGGGGGAMPMMPMNPMAMAMGMGMNNFNQMGAMNPGMNMMGANMAGMGGMANGMNPMAPMANMANMNNMGAMRLGMGPMGGGGMGGMGAGMGVGMGTSMAPGMAVGMGAGMGAGMGTGMGTGMMGVGMNGMAGMGSMAGMGMAGMRHAMSGMGTLGGRMAVNTGPGPSRMSNRGQHSFHPYSR